MNSKVSNITIIREALQNHAANELSKHIGLPVVLVNFFLEENV